MTDAQRLVFLKSNLEIIPQSSLQDEYLQNLLTAAQEMITREGIVLTDEIEDDNLIVMYAAYLYRKRAEDLPVMPRMLRYALNNRLFSEKMKGADDNA